MVRLVETEHMTIGIWIQDMNVDKQRFCMEFLNRGKVATQSQSKFDCLVKNEEHKQTINTKYYEMNCASILEERFCGHLKRTARASKHEF